MQHYNVDARSCQTNATRGGQVYSHKLPSNSNRDIKASPGKCSPRRYSMIPFVSYASPRYLEIGIVLVIGSLKNIASTP
jgi:hypothetical protein